MIIFIIYFLYIAYNNCNLISFICFLFAFKLFYVNVLFFWMCFFILFKYFKFRIFNMILNKSFFVLPVKVMILYRIQKNCQRIVIILLQMFNKNFIYCHLKYFQLTLNLLITYFMFFWHYYLLHFFRVSFFITFLL